MLGYRLALDFTNAVGTVNRGIVAAWVPPRGQDLTTLDCFDAEDLSRRDLVGVWAYRSGTADTSTQIPVMQGTNAINENVKARRRVQEGQHFVLRRRGVSAINESNQGVLIVFQAV